MHIAAFIDPFFSSGVHLAMTGGLSAACTIAASRNGKCEEASASKFHSLKVGAAYTRSVRLLCGSRDRITLMLKRVCSFLIVVLGIYKQITAQREPVLQDVDEGNFDRAFVLFRPSEYLLPSC